MKPMFLAMAGLLVLAACDAQTSDGPQTASANISAEGKAEDSKFSIKAPGVDLKLDLPKGAEGHINADADDDLIYPGSKLGGVHIEGGKGGGAVELRFSSVDPPEKVFAWYRDTARTDFTLDKAEPEGTGFVLNGRGKDGGDPFKIRLVPSNGGGTEGTLSVAGKN